MAKTVTAKTVTSKTAVGKTGATKRVKIPAAIRCCSVLDAALDERDAEKLAEGFKALADPVRVRLLSLIAARPGGEACACELIDVLDRSQPTISHHLKLLHEAGLVTREKRGTWAWFKVVPERLEELRAALAPTATRRA